MNVVVEINDLRRERRINPLATWGLVPTMGYLHEGHLSLVRRARQENDRIGVSIFVNPNQFNDPADLAIYPTDMERDLALLEAEGVDLVWTPTPQIVYPEHYQTYIEVEHVTRPLEGASRPGHFRGVATVVAKLFNVFQPKRAYFGQKDAQQVTVIRRMVEDLNFDIDLVICPTVREPDGLALSSRNVNLSPNARAQAPALYEALTTAQAALLAGEGEVKTLRQMMETIINAAPLAEIDYISIADPTTLAELETVENGALLSMAVWVGGVRLIDNLIVTPNPDEPEP